MFERQVFPRDLKPLIDLQLCASLGPSLFEGGAIVRGLGAFQMAQMKHRDARVLEFYRHVRSAIDALELIALDPYQPPEKPVREPGAVPASPSPAPVIPAEKITYTMKEAAAALR